MIKSGFNFVFFEKLCVTDKSDASGNSPPPGYLWLRKVNDVCGPRITMKVEDTFTDNNVHFDKVGEVLGVINVLTGKMFSILEIDNISHYSPFKTEDDLVLYNSLTYEKSKFWFYVNKFLFRRK
jgi:hypothetical protein